MAMREIKVGVFLWGTAYRTCSWYPEIRAGPAGLILDTVALPKAGELQQLQAVEQISSIMLSLGMGFLVPSKEDLANCPWDKSVIPELQVQGNRAGAQPCTRSHFWQTDQALSSGCPKPHQFLQQMIVGTFWVLLSQGHQSLEPGAAEMDWWMITSSSKLLIFVLHKYLSWNGQCQRGWCSPPEPPLTGKTHSSLCSIGARAKQGMEKSAAVRERGKERETFQKDPFASQNCRHSREMGPWQRCATLL